MAREGPTIYIMHLFNSVEDEDMHAYDLEAEVEEEGSSGSPIAVAYVLWLELHHLSHHQQEKMQLEMKLMVHSEEITKSQLSVYLLFGGWNSEVLTREE